MMTRVEKSLQCVVMTAFLLFQLSAPMLLSAQTQQHNDTTDLFYRHLTLREVIVTSTTGNTKLKHTTTPITLLSAQDIRQHSFTNIIDGIAHLPGVAQISTGNGISKPVIRGLSYNRIVTVHDGIRQEGQQWGDEHGIEIDDNGINQVQVLKGSASLMYGSDALGGVLVLNSAPPVRDGSVYGNASAEYQTNSGLFAYMLNTGGNSGAWSWDMRYSDRMAHAYKVPVDGYVPNSQLRQQGISGMLSMQQKWGFARMRLSYFHLLPSIAEGERDEITGRLLCPYGDIKRYAHGLPYQRVDHYKASYDQMLYVGGGTLNILAAYQQNVRREMEEEDGEEITGLYFNLHTGNADIRYSRTLDNGWKYSTGVATMLQRSFNKGEEFLIPAYRLIDIGAYFTTERNLDRLDINGGVRLDRRWLHSYQLIDDEQLRFSAFSQRFFGLTASTGIAYHPSDRLTLKANLARGYRAPNISELGSNGEHEGTLRYEIGNKNLRPEYSLQADLGLDYANPWIAMQVNAFANRIDNYIYLERMSEALPTHDTPLYIYTAGDAILVGGEISTDFHPIHSLHIGNTLSYVNARRMHASGDSRHLPMIPPLRYTAEVKYELNHDAKTFNNTYVALGMQCNARQNHYLAANDTETPTSGYTLFHISAGTEVYCRGIKIATLTLVADNVFNKAYYSHLSRLKYADVNSVTGRQGIFNPGRNITLKVAIPIVMAR